MKVIVAYLLSRASCWAKVNTEVGLSLTTGPTKETFSSGSTNLHHYLPIFSFLNIGYDSASHFCRPLPVGSFNRHKETWLPLQTPNKMSTYLLTFRKAFRTQSRSQPRRRHRTPPLVSVEEIGPELAWVLASLWLLPWLLPLLFL